MWGGVVWGGVVWGEYLRYCDTLNDTEQGLYRIFCWEGGGGEGIAQNVTVIILCNIV